MLNYLSRVNLSTPLKNLLNNITAEYNLGTIIAYRHIPIGYEDCNIKLETNKGRYLIKIFSKRHQLPFIQDYIQALILFAKAGIPTPSLIKGNKGYIHSSSESSGTTYLCVMDFFEGKSFNEITATQKDLLIITSYLAKIHTINSNIHWNYDSWGTSHLLEEFPKKKQYLERDYLVLIEPIIEQMQSIDFFQFRKCIIHGALEKQNVLKNNSGEYCILDLGCMDFNAAVVDLAIFLAAFCLNPSFPIDKNRKIYQIVVQQYQKTNRLNAAEIAFLPLLIKATYATYLLTANYLAIKEHDQSQQTKNFLSLGRDGLRTLNQFN